jgi:hypothetical protein
MIYPRPVLAPRPAAFGVSLVLTSCLLAGCAVTPGTMTRALSRQSQDSSLTFHYVADNDGDYIDQVVEIDNDGDGPVAPVLKYVALDRDGRPMPNVQVVTAFGSDHGNVVVPASGAWEIVEFTGPDHEDVADVQVTVVKSQRATYPPVETEPDTVALDDTGNEDEYFDDFRSVRVTNDNDDPVQVRLAYVVWNGDDDTTDPVQFQVSVPIGGLTTVPGHGDTVVEVDPTALASILQYGGDFPANVLAFYSH